MKKKLRSAFLLESLEARLLFSADMAPLPVDGGNSGAEVQSDLELSLRPDNGGVQQTDTNEHLRQEIIFVDEAVDNYQQLIVDLESQREKGRRFDIVSLDSDHDGIAQISAYLSRQEGIDAVHVVSHGSDGAVKLGNVWLTPDTLDAHAEAIEGWQQALAGDADLLFYGCNLAAGDNGQELFNSLALLTGADVAASDDVTGSAKFGGDWNLEYAKGEIETAVAVIPETQQSWEGVLAVFTVDTTADTVDNNLGDGNAKDAFNNTSLRAAIMEANALGGANEIILNAGIYTLSLGPVGDDASANGDLDITSDLTITGAGAGVTIIDGGGLDRVFDIRSLGNLAMSNITVQGGDTTGSGGGLRVNSGGQLTLNNIRITGNQADQGGGLYNAGTAMLTDVEFLNNGSPTTATGGGIHNDGDATLNRVTISGSQADSGAGIYNDNSATNLSLTNTTISGNTAASTGGGLYTRAPVTSVNSTFTLNLSDTGGGIRTQGGGGTVDLLNTIIADNSASSSNPDVSGTFNSSGSNLIGDGTGTSDLVDGVNNDQVGTAGSPIDPLLGSFQDNGGFTRTHALMGGSPAIDAGNNAGAPTEDQRGIVRPLDGDSNLIPTVDIGAFESQNNALVVDTTSDTNDGDTSTITTLIGNKGADGRISLREAIIASNNTANLDSADWILFNISGAGTHTIAPTSALPTITDAVTIDATTDDSFAANGNKPAIVLEGNDFGFGWNGLVLTSTADGSTIRGLVIRNWDADGIVIQAGSDNNVIVGNYIGRLNPDGTASGAGTRNNGNGIYILGSNNIIGGASVGAGNLISGNGENGIRITGAGGNVIEGNYLGTDAVGTADLGNSLDGILIDDSANNVIGGTTPQTRNIISGNNIHGVRIIGTASTNNTVQGNYIGVNASGSGPLGNTYNGIWVAAGANNNLIGGTAPGAGNVISGNSDTGIEIQDSNSTGNRIEGNIIGLNAAGTAAIGNLDGVIIEDAPNNTIGGATSAQRNVISGNAGGFQGHGVVIFGANAIGNLVQNNYIGTDITGTLDLGNAGSGVLISDNGDGGVFKGGASGNTIRDNVLSGNNYSGVSIANPGADNNFIFGNVIGADSSGLGALGNSVFGVVIWNGASGNRIGGTAAGEGNVIAFNNRGVIVDANFTASMNNAIRGNSIHSNTLLGIDLRNDGVTINDLGDGDFGPNGLRNYPIITSAVVSGSDLTLTGTLNTLSSLTNQIDFYWSPTGDPSGHGEGQTFIGTTNVTSNFFGNASFNVTFFGVSVPVGAAVTATATDLSGNTSEFAQNDTTIKGNEAPVVIAPGSALNATEQIGLAIEGMGFSVSDSDEAGAGALATLAVGEGTISVVEGNSGVTIDSGDGTATVILSGSIAQLNALLTGTSTGTITYLNNSDTPGSNTTLTVTVNDQGNTGSDPGLTGDGSSEEGSNTVTINIVSVNDAPTITSVANTAATEDLAYSYTFTVNDVDVGDSLTLSAPTLPTWLSFDPATGILAGTPTNNEVGDHAVVLRVNDGTVDVDQSFTITVANTNDAPTITSVANTAATEDLAYSYTFTVNDVDVGDSLTLSAPTLPTWLSFDPATGILAGTPTNNEVGDHAVVLRVNDGTVDVDQSFTITVANTNDAPTITSVANTAATEDLAYSYTFTVNDVDVGDSLTLSAPTLPTWLSFDPATGILAGTPTNNEVGDHAVVLRVNDGTVDVDQSFTITVANTNDAPTITSVANTAATEDLAYSYTFTVNDVDVGDSLTLSAPTLPTWLSFDPATGILAGTPTNNEVGDHAVVLRVNDGTVDVDQSFTITVANTNDAPTITSVANTAATEDLAYSYTFTVNDVDVGDSLTLSAPTLPTWLSFDPATGILAGTPTNNEVGDHAVVLRVNDGTVDVDQSFTITVANTNDAPTITSVANTAATEDLAYSYTFTVNDVDVGDSLTLSAPTLPTWLSFDPATGILAGTPTNNEVGDHAVVLRVNDGTVDVDQSFTINVANVNDAGTVTIDNTTPAQGDTLTANVIDPDGVSGAISYQWFYDGVAIGGANGKTYTTTQADVGTIITVTAVYTDDLGTVESLTSAGTAQVMNVNETPVAVNDNLNATEDQSITFTSVTDLFSNDTDIDGDALALSGFTQPTNGTLADNGDGTFTYTPVANFYGTDGFTYTISDGNGGTATGTAIIVVTPVGDTPQVSNVSTNAETQSGLIFINRNANDGAEVTHFKISGITNGTLYLADGITRIENGDYITAEQGQAGLKFTPAADSTADGSFNVESSEDGVSVSSQSGTATSIITVSAPASQPSASEHSPPPSEPEPVTDEEVMEEEGEDSEDVADETYAPVDADNVFWMETPQTSKAPGTIKPVFHPNISFLNQADSDSDDDKTPDSSTLVSPQTLKLLLEAKNLGELKAALGKLDITTLSPDAYELMKNSLDAVKEEIGKEMIMDRAVLGSAIATSVGLSAGYVVWMLKGGSLLASVLSSLPVWQLADPLAILVGKKEEEDDEEDDSLKTIIEGSSGPDDEEQGETSKSDNIRKESLK